MKIGTLLGKLRRSRKLTTREIAELTGVSVSTYTDWENDKSSPSLQSFFKLANAFGVPPVEFMAYLTGEVEAIVPSEDRISISELREVIRNYRSYADSLRGSEK